MRNEKGFTLIEMLIVLAIITTLLILLIPNLADKNEAIQKKGCVALIQLTENQLESYKIEEGSYPSAVSILVAEDYIQSDTCANGTQRVVYDEKGDDGNTLTTIPVEKKQ